MEWTPVSLPGAYLITPKVFADERGFFLESYVQREFADHGIDAVFVQDNHSRSTQAGVLRGLHAQFPPDAQAKLVRCVRGEVYDVIVDIRRGSPAYGRWEGFTLSESNKKMLFVPRGFAHGFCTLAADTEVLYKADCYYAPKSDRGIRWDDPDLAIRWPVTAPVLSAKDKALPPWSAFDSPFRYR